MSGVSGVVSEGNLEVKRTFFRTTRRSGYYLETPEGSLELPMAQAALVVPVFPGLFRRGRLMPTTD